MTVIRPNSVSGINSITAQANEIKIFKSDGTQGGLIDGANLNATSGISTIAALIVTGNVSVGGTLTYQDVTNTDSVGIVTARAGVKVPDNQKVFLGTDSDLEIYHDGSNARIKNTTGQLWLQSDNGIRFVDSDVNESTARFTDNGAVELYYDGTKKFETTSSGVTVTGSATVTEGLVLDGQNGSGKGLRLDLAGSDDYIIQETTTNDVVQFGGTGSVNFFTHNISSGKIGIGTTNAGYNLELHGASGASNLKIGSRITNSDYGVAFGYFDELGGKHGFGIDRKHGGTLTTDAFVLRADTGKVGINYDTPDYMLEVHNPDPGNDSKQLIQRWINTTQNTLELHMYGGSVDLCQFATTNAEQRLSFLTGVASGNVDSTHHSLLLTQNRDAWFQGPNLSLIHI